VAFQHEVDRGVEQGVTGTDERRERLALGSNEGLLEDDALVPRQDSLADAGEAVSVAHRGGHVTHLEATRLALADGPAELLERLEEEGLDVVGLQPARLRTLHVLAHARKPARVHRVAHERSLLEQILDLRSVNGVCDRLREARAHLRLLAVPDRLDQQIAQGAPLELELAEHVEHLSTERLAGLFEFLEQRVVDVALARLHRDEVPEVADLGLADAVDAPEPLLDPIRVPGQVVVDHEVGTLEVDALAGGVGREEDLHLGVVEEGLLRLAPLLAAQASMDDDHRFLAAEQRGDALL